MAMARRWWLTAIICAVTVGSSFALASSRPTVYTGEMRLAVGVGELSALAIPGFPTASSDLAANYARWVRMEGTGAYKPPDSVVEVRSSPIASSNVIRIEVDSTSKKDALAAAQGLGEALIGEVNAVKEGYDPAVLLAEVVKNTDALNTAEFAVQAAQKSLDDLNARGGTPEQIAAAQRTFIKADRRRVELQVQQNGRTDRYRRLVQQQTDEADLTVLAPGAILIGNNRSATTQRFLIVGLGAGILISLVVASLLDRRGQGSWRGRGTQPG